MNKKAKICIAVIAILLAVSVAASFWIYNHEASQCTAYIYQNGQLIQSIDLNQVTESYTFVIEGDDGASNTIEVRPGEIAIIEATCPDKVCINMGFIKNELLPITCLPNKLVIEIDEGGMTTEENLDGISK